MYNLLFCLNMQEAEAKAASSEEKERSVNERLSQSLFRITVLETQVCASISSKTKIW
jgi:TATA element modulatory factor